MLLGCYRFVVAANCNVVVCDNVDHDDVDGIVFDDDFGHDVFRLVHNNYFGTNRHCDGWGCCRESHTRHSLHHCESKVTGRLMIS